MYLNLPLWKYSHFFLYVLQLIKVNDSNNIKYFILFKFRFLVRPSRVQRMFSLSSNDQTNYSQPGAVFLCVRLFGLVVPEQGIEHVKNLHLFGFGNIGNGLDPFQYLLSVTSTELLPSR